MCKLLYPPPNPFEFFPKIHPIWYIQQPFPYRWTCLYMCTCLDLSVCPKKWMGLAIACLCHCSLSRMALIVVTVVASEPIRNSTCYTWMQITFLSLKPNVNVTVNASNAHFSSCISARSNNAQVHSNLFDHIQCIINSGLKERGIRPSSWRLTLWLSNCFQYRVNA